MDGEAAGFFHSQSDDVREATSLEPKYQKRPRGFLQFPLEKLTLCPDTEEEEEEEELSPVWRGPHVSAVTEDVHLNHQ